MTQSQSPFVTALGRAGYRLTGPRRAVADLIGAADGHFTAAELAAEATNRRQPIGRATIFRALELFTDLGLVERLDLPSGVHAYVPCDPRHHHHAVCGRCGRSTPVDDDGIDTLLEAVAGRTGYRIDGHRLEMYGTCPACLLAEQATSGVVTRASVPGRAKAVPRASTRGLA